MECSAEEFLSPKVILEFIAMDRPIIKLIALHCINSQASNWDKKVMGEDLLQVLGSNVVFRGVQVKFVPSGVDGHLYSLRYRGSCQTKGSQGLHKL